jgi:hypothetical protein
MLRDDQYNQAAARSTEVRKFKATQKLAFLTNGVQIAGTPGLILNETTQAGQNEVNALKTRGDNYANLSYQRAGILRAEGRSAFLGSIVSATGKAYNMITSSQTPTSGLGGLGS